MAGARRFDAERAARRLEEGVEKLSKFSRPGPGVTRISLTAEYQEALSYLAREFEELGFQTGYDPVGNFIAANVTPGEPCVALGSHVDSVPCGGRYDGVAGVLGALEVARTIPEHPLKVFSFIEEEGSRFGGLLGSRCVAGLVSARDLEEARDESGTSFRDAAREWGHDPDSVENCPESLKGIEKYLELHIEQGRVLETTGHEVGVVEAIAGVVHASIEIEGHADHAGATPMDIRSDSGVTAAEVVLELDRITREVGGSCVGTAGQIHFLPGAINVIPGRADVGLDVRGTDEGKRDDVVERVIAFARDRAESRGQQLAYREHFRTPPTAMYPGVVADLVKAACRIGLSHRQMASGAGHDAMVVARRVPSGMIFVPSRDGVSHSPEEFTEPDHLAAAVAVLVEAITKGGTRTTNEACPQ